LRLPPNLAGDNRDGEEVETIKEPMVEYGVAKYVLPGQGESGDHHLVCCNQRGVLIAVIDGIGHGEEAANASKTAGALLKSLATNQLFLSLNDARKT